MADDDKKVEKTDDKPTGKVDEKTDDTAGLKSALEKEREARKSAEREAKVNADAAKKLKELEDADKSEVEKAVARAEAAERKATDAEARAARLEVAIEKGLTFSQAKRLMGSTREELEADADELLEAFGSKSAAESAKNGKSDKADAKRRPTESLRSGARTDTSDDEEVDAKRADEIAESVVKSGGI